MRVRCDRGVQERPCEGAVRPRQPCASVPPSHFENFRQAWQKCVAKFGNARPRPKQDKYVRTRSTSVKKERRGFPSRDLIDTNPRFTCQLMRIFFSKDQRANHLTPHRLINAAPCKPTFSLPHAMQGILMSLVANPINFASISVSGPLQIVILIYWPCVQKNGGSNYI